jgi:hypothetical protein
MSEWCLSLAKQALCCLSSNLFLSYLTILSHPVATPLMKVVLPSAVSFISKNNKDTHITPKFHNKTIVLHFFSSYYKFFNVALTKLV